jgi:hypothetical protein
MQTFLSHINGYYDIADQLPHLLRREAEHVLAQQLDSKNAITTIAQFEAHRTQVQANFLTAIGGLPERTGARMPAIFQRFDNRCQNWYKDDQASFSCLRVKRVWMVRWRS